MGRCYVKTNTAYKRYGAAGISVCDRWHSFENFLLDMGDRPAGYTIDRKDGTGNYTSENCRWATYTEQANNQKSNKLLVIGGETQTLANWCRRYEADYFRVARRLRRGWSVERALTEPPRTVARF